MVHALMVMTVPGRAGLMAVDLDRQAVDIDAQVSVPVTAAHAAQPPSRQFDDRLMQHGTVLRRAQNRDQA